MNAARSPWRAFWRRRALRPADRWIAPLLGSYAAELVADKGGSDATAAERRLVELAALARGCSMLVLAEAASGSGLVPRDRKGPDLGATLARFATVECRALLGLGLGRRARTVPSALALLRGERGADDA